MRFDGTGKIADDFYVLGSPHVPVYLLDGASPVLFEAGLTALSKVYEEDIRKVLNNRAPAYLFLTHSHFDHVGAASRLKALWPKMRIIGFSKVGEILARSGAVDLIRTLNQISACNLPKRLETSIPACFLLLKTSRGSKIWLRTRARGSSRKLRIT